VNSLPVGVREVVERTLTEKQREAFELELAGWGVMRIARRLGVTKGAIVDRLHNAHTKLSKEGVRMDEFGRWYLERVA
jgi:DNA-directed RNA polymerase specialized sigma24 family protein